MPMPNVKIIHFDQCDPKKCSGSRMIKFGLARVIKPNKIGKALLLSPISSIALSPADRGIMEEFGLVLIDGSWNQIESLKPFFLRGTPRALPFLVAANTVNFGKPTKLNTIEATIAALWILGYKNKAEDYANRFKYGNTFIQLNFERLEKYSQASSSSEVVEIQKQIMNELYGED